jgi:hypothetical protein
MVSQDLLEILRCPACVREKDGLLDYMKEAWLVCRDCGRKYPIREGQSKRRSSPNAGRVGHTWPVARPV